MRGQTTHCQHTPSPWSIAPHPDDAEFLEIVSEYSELPGGRKMANWIAQCDAALDCNLDSAELERRLAENAANAHLIAAAPDLFNGCNALLGLLMLVLSRDDVPAEIRDALTNNHRVEEAKAAIAKAEAS